MRQKLRADAAPPKGKRDTEAEVRKAYPHPATTTALAALRRRKQVHGLYWAVGAAIVMGVAASLIAGAIGLPFAMFAAVLGFLHGRKVRESEYYALPHSRDYAAQHRCIHCGNRGIYRKGEYRSTNTYAYCSKCGAFLFLC